MTPTLRLLLVSSLLSLGGAVTSAHAGGLLRSGVKQQLGARKSDAQAAKRRDHHAVNAALGRMARLGDALVPTGAAEVVVSSRPVESARDLGVAAGNGVELREEVVLVRQQVPGKPQAQPVRDRFGIVVGAQRVATQRDGYVPHIRIMGTANGGTRMLSHLALLSDKQFVAGQVGVAATRISGLAGAISPTRVTTLRKRALQAQRNLSAIDRLRGELRGQLREGEEVFLLAGELPSVPLRTATEGHRVTARLVIVRQPVANRRATKGVAMRMGQAPLHQALVLRTREVDQNGALVQELDMTVGPAASGHAITSDKIFELIGSVSVGEMLDNANRSLAELARDSR